MAAPISTPTSPIIKPTTHRDQHHHALRNLRDAPSSGRFRLCRPLGNASFSVLTPPSPHPGPAFPPPCPAWQCECLACFAQPPADSPYPHGMVWGNLENLILHLTGSHAIGAGLLIVFGGTQAAAVAASAHAWVPAWCKVRERGGDACCTCRAATHRVCTHLLPLPYPQHFYQYYQQALQDRSVQEARLDGKRAAGVCACRVSLSSSFPPQLTPSSPHFPNFLTQTPPPSLASLPQPTASRAVATTTCWPSTVRWMGRVSLTSSSSSSNSARA
jgi:hypothetical protein